MTGDSGYTLAIKTVADLKALADADRALKLSTEDAKKLADAMDVLRQKSDAASKSAVAAAEAMMARQKWLASLPPPTITDNSGSTATGRNIPGGIVNAGMRTVYPGDAAASQAQMGRYDREDAIHQQRIAGVVGSGGAGSGAPLAGQAVKETTGSVTDLGSALGSLAGKAITWYAAWQTVKKGLKETVAASAENEQTINALSEALVRNGTYSSGYVEHLKNLAVQYQNLTGIAQGEWLEVFGKLSQFGADASNIDQYASAVKNLAGIYGSMDTAVIAMQKALEGNFETFRRHGIYIDQNATQAEKLKSLLQQLGTVGGGQLEAKMEGLAGAWKQMETNGHDLGVQIGNHISKWLQLENLTRALGTALGFYANKLRDVGDETGKTNLAGARHVQNMHEQKEQARALRDDMEKLRDAYHKTVEQLQGMAHAYDALDRAQGETEGKKKEKELAIVQDKVTRKIFTEQQGLIEKAKIEEKYERMDEQRKERAIRRDMQLKDMELQAAISQQSALAGQIAQAKANQVSGSQAEAQKATADAAKTAFQENERKLDAVNKKLEEHKANKPWFMTEEAWMSKTDTGSELSASKTQLEFNRGKLGRKSDEESGKVTDLATKSKNDDERIKQLEEAKLRQDQDVAKKRFDAFNTANIGNAEINQYRNQRREDAQKRQIGLGTDLFSANGGAPQLHMSPQQMAEQTLRQQREVMTQFGQALQSRDTITAEALLAVLQGLRVNANDYNRLKAAVTMLERQIANRPGG